MKLTGILTLSIISISFLSCKTEDVILHGEIAGIVTNTASGDPIGDVTMTLTQTNDNTRTGSDGKFMLKDLIPGEYEIQAIKSGYAPLTKNVTVSPAKTLEMDFRLTGTPVTDVSVNYLDFGLDSTRLSFAISNTGFGKLKYVITTSQEWISVNHPIGEIINETDSITVTINKSGLSQSVRRESLIITSIADHVDIPDITINVYMNGVMDLDTNYYSVVNIGTQTWMAENLKVGSQVPSYNDQSDNGIIEYYSFDDLGSKHDIYGGLYQWNEMMQYSPSDNKPIGTSQGICPVGWHIPTNNEWQTLIFNLGGKSEAGGKLKETGTLHWASPNEAATDESHFSGLPGGLFGWYGTNFERVFQFEKTNGMWWSSSKLTGQYDQAQGWNLNSDTGVIEDVSVGVLMGCSVRCVKNTGQQ